jgi:hypothetical protein
MEDLYTSPQENMAIMMLVANIAGNLMAGGHYTTVAYAVGTAREIVAKAYTFNAAGQTEAAGPWPVEFEAAASQRARDDDGRAW